MKKIFVFLAALFFSCMANADSTTTRAGLTKPTPGSTSWATKMNNNLDIIDSKFALLTYAPGQGMTGPFTFNSTATFKYAIGVSSSIASYTSGAYGLLEGPSLSLMGYSGGYAYLNLGGTTNPATLPYKQVNIWQNENGTFLSNTSPSGFFVFRINGTNRLIVQPSGISADAASIAGTVSAYSAQISTLTIGSTVSTYPFTLNGSGVIKGAGNGLCFPDGSCMYSAGVGTSTNTVFTSSNSLTFNADVLAGGTGDIIFKTGATTKATIWNGGGLTVGSSVTASAYYGDGSHLSGVITSTSAFVLRAGDNMTGQLTTASTMTVQGNAFSVGASTLVVTNGFIGMGMYPENPDARLQVLGQIKSSGTASSIIFGDRSNSAHSWEWYSSGDTAGLYKNHNTAGTVLYAAPSGNIGVGTSSPAEALDVTGNIKMSGDIIGKTDGSNAAAGGVGEYKSAYNYSPVSLTGVYQATDGTSLSLTAGDWMVYGEIWTASGGASGIGIGEIGFGTSPGNSYLPETTVGLWATDGRLGQITTMQRMVLTTTTTVYLKALLQSYTGGPPTIFTSKIKAWRVR